MANRYKLINGTRVPLTASEKKAKEAEELAWANSAFDRAIKVLRDKRNKLLADCDWEVVMAKEKGTTLSTAFKNYRQALRDITDDLTTEAEVQAVEFPTKP